MTAKLTPIGKLTTNDAHFSVWNDEVNADVARVMESVKHVFRAAGWRLRLDPETLKNFPSIAGDYLYSIKDGLELKLSVGGRHIKAEFFQNVQNVEHPAGGFFDYEKMQRMPYLMRKRVELMFGKLEAHLMAKFGYRQAESDFPRVGLVGSTAREFAEHQIRTTGHYREHLGRADYSMQCNRTSGDKQELNHGDFVYFLDYKGNWGYGQAFYGLNSSWYVVSGRYGLHNVAAHNLYVNKPENLRERDNRDLGIRRLRQELEKAVKAEDFLRAHQLKGIINKLAPPQKLAA